MIFKYNVEIKANTVKNNLKRLTGQIYKLLPNREEGVDWKKPLKTIIEELVGMQRLFLDQEPIFFALLCKLEGLFELIKEDDFEDYRRVIFESIGLISKISEKCLD